MEGEIGMKTPLITNRTCFDVHALWSGRAVSLVYPPDGFDGRVRKDRCLVKSVTPLEITLLRVYEEKVEEKTYIAEAFEGVGCYSLELLIPESELESKKEESE